MNQIKHQGGKILKKLLFVFITFTLLLTSGCSSTFIAKEHFSLPLQIKATLKGSDSQFTANIFENGCDITFDEGHPLCGTVLRFRDDGNTASVGDIFTREIKNGTFPAQEALYKAVKLISETDLTFSPAENGFKQTIDEMTIMVYYNEDTETVSGIETEESGRRFTFVFAALEPYEAQSNSTGQP